MEPWALRRVHPPAGGLRRWKRLEERTALSQLAAMNRAGPVLLSQAKGRLGALCRKSEATPLVKRGQVLGFIVPRKRMEALLDYVEILSNPEAMKAIARARAGKRRRHPLSAIRAD